MGKKLTAQQSWTIMCSTCRLTFLFKNYY
jgi:hypothetical protein